MKYYCKDFWENKTLKFDTDKELAKWWVRQFESWDTEMKFSQLNVTGKDCGWAYPKKDSFFCAFLPKRYQIFDDAGRSVDIRLWPKSIWEEARPKPTSFYLGYSGRKYNVRKCHAPFGLHRMVQVRAEAYCHKRLTEVDEDIEAFPIPCVRTKSKIPEWDIDDYYNGQGNQKPDNSWKTRSRCRKQWQRHMNVHGRNGQAAKQTLSEDWYTIEPEEDMWLDDCEDPLVQPPNNFDLEVECFDNW